MLLLLILLVSFNSILNIESCQIYETKRICDCSLLYQDDSNTRIKLFSIPSYEDCGFNLSI